MAWLKKIWFELWDLITIDEMLHDPLFNGAIDPDASCTRFSNQIFFFMWTNQGNCLWFQKQYREKKNSDELESLKLTINVNVFLSTCSVCVSPMIDSVQGVPHLLPSPCWDRFQSIIHQSSWWMDSCQLFRFRFRYFFCPHWGRTIMQLSCFSFF